MQEFAIFLLIVGLVGLYLTSLAVYMKINTARLSMNFLDGEKIKEHTQGLTWKPRLWYVLQDPEINMTASVILTSGGVELMSWEEFLAKKAHDIKPRAYETKDGVLFGTWATALTPLRGHLSKMVRRTPGAGALMTLAKIELAMSTKLIGMSTAKALKNKKAIGKFVANIFEGETTASPHEQAYGMSVFDPKLFDLNFGKKAQDAVEKRMEAAEFRKAVEDMLATVGGDADKARTAVEIATGLTKRQILGLDEGTLAGVSAAFLKWKGK